MSIKVGDKVKYIGVFYLTLQGVTGVVESVEDNFRQEATTWMTVRFPTHYDKGRSTCEKLLPCLQRELELVG